VPAGWTVAGVADFNGDGKPDYYLFKPSTGALVVWLLNGNTLIGAATLPSPPPGWQLATLADLNADGKPDLVLSNPTTGSLAVWILNGTTLANSVHITQAGVSKSLPAGWKIAGAGDFDRDGKPDLLLSNATTLQTTVWYLTGTEYLGQAAGPTLPSGWTLTGVADFTADGKPDFLIFATATRKSGLWTLNGTTVVTASYLVDGVGTPLILPPGYSLVPP
jgi:hypothetical protein